MILFFVRGARCAVVLNDCLTPSEPPRTQIGFVLKENTDIEPPLELAVIARRDILLAQSRMGKYALQEALLPVVEWLDTKHFRAEPPTFVIYGTDSNVELEFPIIPTTNNAD